ncbi:MAG: HPr family phosphocarrier protein [Proteobacteria bacterium]|nr:MAG: HPr family phosphocarrier protein [Pseudomonadota bacterium]
MSEMTREVTIRNTKGLHVRAATVLAKTAARYQASVTIAHNGEVVDAKSIMGLLLLTAARGTRIVVRARGDDAAQAVDAIGELVEAGFHE